MNTSIAAYESELNQALRRVAGDRAKNRRYMKEALKVLKTSSHVWYRFTSLDLLEHMRTYHPTLVPTDDRVVGVAFQEAARRGWIKKTKDFAAVGSHGRPCRVWAGVA